MAGRKLIVKLQGVSSTAVNSQKCSVTAVKPIECCFNSQYPLFIPPGRGEGGTHQDFCSSVTAPLKKKNEVDLCCVCPTKEVSRSSRCSRRTWCPSKVQVFESCPLNVSARIHVVSPSEACEVGRLSFPWREILPELRSPSLFWRTWLELRHERHFSVAHQPPLIGRAEILSQLLGKQMSPRPRQSAFAA